MEEPENTDHTEQMVKVFKQSHRTIHGLFRVFRTTIG